MKRCWWRPDESRRRRPPPRPSIVRPLAARQGERRRPTPAPLRSRAPPVDARVLVITAKGDNAAIRGDSDQRLQYLGTPFDVLNASTGPALTAATLRLGNARPVQRHLSRHGDLVGGSSAFTDAEWTALTTYEVEFGVRRVSLYTSPSASYGLADDDAGVDPSTSPISASCTAAGKALFVGTNCANPVVINQGFAYPRRPLDNATTPLLADASGKVYAATRSYPDGREALALTFGQAPNLRLVPRARLWPGELGDARAVRRRAPRLRRAADRRLFLASAIYTGGVYRITDADLQAFADWQARGAGQPAHGRFRRGLGGQRGGVVLAPRRSVDGQGGRARAGVRVDQPQLGSPGARWDELRRRGQRVHPQRSVPARARPHALCVDQRGHAQRLGARQRGRHAGAPRQRHPADRQRHLGARPEQSLSERRHLERARALGPRAPAQAGRSLLQRLAALRVDPGVPGAAPDRRHRLPDPQGEAERRSLQVHAERQQRRLDVSPGKHPQLRRCRAQPPQRSARRRVRQVRRGDDLPDREPDHGRPRGPGAKSDGARRVGRGGHDWRGGLTVTVAHAATIPVTGLCTPGAESYAGQSISYLALADGQTATYALGGCSGATDPGDGNGGAGGSGRARRARRRRRGWNARTGEPSTVAAPPTSVWRAGRP